MAPHSRLLIKLHFVPKEFLAHLSMKCSECAIVIATCWSSFVRHSSCIINFLACVCSRGHIFSLIIMKLGWNVCLDEISKKFEMGHVKLKTRSLGQISEKLYVRSRGHIFSPLIMKLGQNDCIDEISYRFENGSCWFKTRSLVQILEKPCVCSRNRITWSECVLMKSRTCLKMGQVRLKTRSEGQIVAKPCVHSTGHIFSQIIVKLGQNVCLH